MMPEHSLPGRSRHTDTLFVFPEGSYAFDRDPSPYRPGTDELKRGPMTEYPIGQTIGDAGRIYWRPQNFILTKASMISDETGPIDFVTPIVPTSYRANGVPQGGFADKLELLAKPTAGEVRATMIHQLSTFLTYECATWFTLFNEIVILPNDRTGHYWKMDGGIQALVTSTDRSIVATTYIIPDNRDKAVLSGNIEVRWKRTPDEPAYNIPLFSIPGAPDNLFAHNVSVEMVLDYAPWTF